MNTLKLKVLLTLTNRHMGWCLSRSIMIWFSTCFVGTAGVFAIDYEFPSVKAFMLSLIFSSPALFLAVPSLYFLTIFQTIQARILFSFITILTACTIIIGVVAIFFNLDYWMVAQSLLPFIPSAIICFYIIARKQIIKTYP